MTNIHLPPDCIVQSVSSTPGRRVITFTRIAPYAGDARRPVKRRKAPFRLQLKTAPEAASSFEPVIQVRSPIKP